MLDEFNNKFNTIRWERVFVDEIVSIKFYKKFNLNSNFYWFLTATPYAFDMIPNIEKFDVPA
jgi:hypothetical protein